jgi:hypothetical protein
MMDGGCACGNVRYTINIDKPIGVGNCHCLTCQKHSGAPYVTVMFVPAKSMYINGHYNSYSTPAESGATMNRSFCGVCGTHIFGQSTANHKIRPVLINTLDDHYDITPQFNFWVSEKAKHGYVDTSMPFFMGQFTKL